LELHRQAVKEAMSSADVKDRHLTALNDPEVRIKLSLSHGGDGDLARIDRRREGTDVYRTSAEHVNIVDQTATSMHTTLSRAFCFLNTLWR
jgi:hypothetical protein